MAITKDQKKEILQELVDKFGKSKAVVFTDYRGLDVASVSDLRSQLREKGAETKVAKKTLIKLAARESKIDGLTDELLAGPVSATFSYEDELAGLKILFKFSKENENLKLLGGIIDGKVVGADEIIQLAKLPGREELLAKLIGSMNASTSGFVGILGNLIGGFVRVLGAYKDTMPADASAEAPAKKEEAPEPAKEEAKTEEPKTEEVPKEEAKAEEPETPASDEPSTSDESTADKPADKPAEPEKEAESEASSDTAATSGDAVEESQPADEGESSKPTADASAEASAKEGEPKAEEAETEATEPADASSEAPAKEEEPSEEEKEEAA